MIRATAFVAVVAEWNDTHMGSRSWMWLWGSFMTLVMIAGVGLIVWLVARGSGHRSRSDLDHARAILADRMARGEIAPDEYQERLSHLH